MSGRAPDLEDSVSEEEWPASAADRRLWRLRRAAVPSEEEDGSGGNLAAGPASCGQRQYNTRRIDPATLPTKRYRAVAPSGSDSDGNSGNADWPANQRDSSSAEQAQPSAGVSRDHSDSIAAGEPGGNRGSDSSGAAEQHPSGQQRRRRRESLRTAAKMPGGRSSAAGEVFRRKLARKRPAPRPEALESARAVTGNAAAQAALAETDSDSSEPPIEACCLQRLLQIFVPHI